MYHSLRASSYDILFWLLSLQFGFFSSLSVSLSGLGFLLLIYRLFVLSSQTVHIVFIARFDLERLQLPSMIPGRPMLPFPSPFGLASLSAPRRVLTRLSLRTRSLPRPPWLFPLLSTSGRSSLRPEATFARTPVLTLILSVVGFLSLSMLFTTDLGM